MENHEDRKNPSLNIGASSILKENRINRRSFLHAAGAAAALGTVGAPFVLRSADAKSLTKIKMILAWLPGGPYAYAYVARKKGYWSKRGLDVDIARGYGSLASAQVVAHGQFDFGMSNPSSLVLLAAQGVKVHMIGLMDYDPFMAVCMKKDSPIKKPKDLEGKTVGETFSSSDAAFFPLFCKVNGVDISKVKRLNMDAKVRNQSIGGGQVDAITGLVSSMLPSLETIGVKTKYFLYGDYGVDLYGNIGITATEQTVKGRPEICQAFMDGLSEGLRYTLLHPKESTDIFMDAVPALKMNSTGVEYTKLGMDVESASVLATGDAKAYGLGWADMNKLKQMEKLVMQYQVKAGTPSPDIEKLFTNKFAGRIKLTDAEWKKVEKETSGINKMIRGA